jgi:hypothetical protein
VSVQPKGAEQAQITRLPTEESREQSRPALPLPD